MKIGVLALQGDVREHRDILQTLGAETVLVRQTRHLEGLDGLVLPGGESSVIDKLSRIFGLFDPIRTAISKGLPVYGTCAGLILLADTLVDSMIGQESFGGLDVTVRRNAFGSQNESFETDIEVSLFPEKTVRAVFIRAPLVESLGPKATPLARLNDGRCVAVEQGNLLGTSFHPEMLGELRFHTYFLSKVRAFSATR